MIKIIKQGVKPKKYKKIYTLTCERCQCEFEFEESDCTKVRHEKCIGGEHTGEINCPFCSERLFIDFTTAEHREEEIIEVPVDLGGSPVIVDMDASYQWSSSLCKCPKCGSNKTLRNDSFILTSIPPQYGFKCEKCGHKWTGYENSVDFTEVIKGINKHCFDCTNKNDVGNDACYCCPHNPIKVTL